VACDALCEIQMSVVLRTATAAVLLGAVVIFRVYAFDLLRDFIQGEGEIGMLIFGLGFLALALVCIGCALALFAFRTPASDATWRGTDS